MGTQKKYTKEFKLHVVQESLLPENRGCMRMIADKYDLYVGTLSHWRNLYKEYGEDGLDSRSLRSLNEKRYKDLEKENAELKEEIEILKKAAAFLAEVGRK